MAKASFIRDEKFEWTLSTVGKTYPEIVETALRAGAAVIAGQMKRNLESILSPWATGQLAAAFGITPVGQNIAGDWNVHIGFDGYQEPLHVPFQLIARTFESGAIRDGKQWRAATPFAKPAVKSKQAEAERAMKEAAEGAITKITSQDRKLKNL